jgi:hypothetical protein
MAAKKHLNRAIALSSLQQGSRGSTTPSQEVTRHFLPTIKDGYQPSRCLSLQHTPALDKGLWRMDTVARQGTRDDMSGAATMSTLGVAP